MTDILEFIYYYNYQPIYASTVLVIVSLIVFAYIFLIDHFLKDSDDIYFKLDECEYYLQVIGDGQINPNRKSYSPTEKYLAKTYINLKMVGSKLHSVGVGVVGIFTLIICFLGWCAGILIISEDLNQYWYLTIPIIAINFYFWRKYLLYIEFLYRRRFKPLQKEFIKFFDKNHTTKKFKNGLNLTEIELCVDKKVKKITSDYSVGLCRNLLMRGNFPWIDNYQRAFLENWRNFWIISMIFALIVVFCLIVGIRFPFYYFIAYISLGIYLLWFRIKFKSQLSTLSKNSCIIGIIIIFGVFVVCLIAPFLFFRIIDFLQKNLSLFKSL